MPCQGQSHHIAIFKGFGFERQRDKNYRQSTPEVIVMGVRTSALIQLLDTE
ncbi:MAG: hypothetical protein HW402_880 [Dehalococcoidales bacterium]|nr:hypothetical protein [Dehalococcoidales bacterium]